LSRAISKKDLDNKII